MSDTGPRIYRFGPFEADLEQRLLFRAGDSVPLTPKAFDTLTVLLTRQGKVVDKSELLKMVWPDTFVEENNLTQNISALRKAFGDQEYIETIPRRGYRFLAGVEEVPAPELPQAPPLAEVTGASGHRFRSLWIWALIAVAAVGTTSYVVSRIRRSSQPAYPLDSLVVLPFVNLTADPEDEYFSDGLTEELTNAVAHLDGLRVVARTTAFQFKARRKTFGRLRGNCGSVQYSKAACGARQGNCASRFN